MYITRNRGFGNSVRSRSAVPGRNDCRQIFAVDFLWLLLRMLSSASSSSTARRCEGVGHFRIKAYLLNHIGYAVCVLGHNLESLFFCPNS